LYFRNRIEAGRLLARNLQTYKDRTDVLVLGLPRGGVPVAYEVARELNAPLDVFIVRKLGVPGQEELGMGAIATGGIRILHERILRELGIPPEIIDLVTEKEQKELKRREHLYRGDRSAPTIQNRTVIVVDDGLATGSTMKAALAALRQQRPARLIVAVPTAPAETCKEIGAIADEVVCPLTPEPFDGVGGSYSDFSQTTDEEVRDLIERIA
jgi:predicted phosphoribosyltransferase